MMWAAPSTQAIGMGEVSTTRRQRNGISSSCLALTVTSSSIVLPLALARDKRFSLRGGDHAIGDSGDQVIVVHDAFADHHSLGGDFVFTDVFAVSAAAHLDNRHDLAASRIRETPQAYWTRKD